MKIAKLLLAIPFFIGCQNTNKKSDTSIDSTVVQQATMAQENDSLSVSLLDIKDSLSSTENIVVADDPVFHQSKSYKAISLKTVLEKFTKLKSLNIEQTHIVFECEDGYNPSMPLEMVLNKKSYIAVADLAAPKGEEWTNPIKNGREMKIAPFYVVYTDVSATERDYKWPYNLVKISLVETAKEFAAVYPKDDDTVVKGYGLFQHNCMTCHALNKVGGKMGPELNYPKNVTEYWRSTDDIKSFVKNPASYRNDCKMPAITYLKDSDLEEIVRYLAYMTKHKPS